ncbi:MAG: acyl-ACP--UDP-N-acetylglucosamine O-acyltransferase [Candidatus Gastranaerophilales bacterium]|nr:acyl-ACP--UDP-N-acetylglucosamine O-acyltransferase [Candidatus Gastranaerophilales bacterium]
MTTDKTAIIHKSAQIADDAIIGPHVIIGENVKIGSGVKIIANAYLEFCEIGEGTVISPFASIGTPPQDLGYKNEPTKVILGKNCLIKENVTINRASGEGNVTAIGDKCLLMVGAHVAHNCHLANEVILANLVTLGGHVSVGFGAFIGGMGVYHQHIRIGEMCIISGFSAARQDILPFSKNDGCPASATGLNVIALKRRGVSQEERTTINEAFKLLISPEYNTTQAIEKIKKEVKINKQIETMIDFIQSSKRGVSLKTHKVRFRTNEENSEVCNG